VFLARHGSTRGFVLSEGINPFYSDIDTHAMAQAVVDEAVRRQLCAGARLDRVALLDNFCWPDPVQSEGTPDGEYKLAQLVRACRGLYEATRAYGTPLISGKDSMKNDSTMGGEKISVPPTLLVSGIGQIDDVRRALSPEPKAPGDLVFLLGATRDETGGSEYFRHLGTRHGLSPGPSEPRPFVSNKVPRLDIGETLPLYRALENAISRGLVRSAATPAKGGWGLTFARVAMAGELGLDLDLARCPDATELDFETLMYSESNGRFLVTVAPDDRDAFRACLAGQACHEVGRVEGGRRLAIRVGDRVKVDASIDALKSAFKETLGDG